MTSECDSASGCKETCLAGLLHGVGRLSRRQADRACGVATEDALAAMSGLGVEELRALRSFGSAWEAAADVVAFPSPPELVNRLPAAIALRHRVVPLALLGRHLVVAVAADAPPAAVQQALERVASHTGLEVLPWPVEPASLGRACHAYYDPHAMRGALARAIELGPGEVDGGRPAEAKAPANAPIVDLVDDILHEAVALNASDVHVDPFEGRAVIRFRVDGILRDGLSVPVALAPAIVTRLKLLADLNIVERRHPQDGRFTFVADDVPVDVRIATTPTRYGELVVMRLLRPLSTTEGLAGLGLLPGDLARYRSLVAAPNGILLVTGPTGSGKSTTLYATLTSLDRVRRNVITIEDPVEYAIERAMQIQVNAGIGLTFAAALRSVLRLDPNVILLGEIRDPETLEIAMHAAMTGHLVLSTLHANDAVTAFARMTELGATSRQIAGSVVGVVAQRLVRRTCAACGGAVAADDAARQELDLPADAAVTLVRGKGCATCGDTGYRGRVGLYEVLAMNDAIGQAVTDGAGIPALRALAREAGMTTMWDDGRAKVLAGLTTPEELSRVVRRT